MNAWWFVGFGFLVGLLQLWSLARSVRSRRAGQLSWLFRFGMTALALFIAARTGHILAAAAGWASGFSLAAIVVRRSWS